MNAALREKHGMNARQRILKDFGWGNLAKMFIKSCRLAINPDWQAEEEAKPAEEEAKPAEEEAKPAEEPAATKSKPKKKSAKSAKASNDKPVAQDANASKPKAKPRRKGKTEEAPPPAASDDPVTQTTVPDLIDSIPGKKVSDSEAQIAAIMNQIQSLTDKVAEIQNNNILT